MRISVQESLAGLAITSRQVQVSNEASTDKRIKFFKEPGRPVKINSLLCAPLIAQDQSWGVLEIWHTHERIFTWHDIRLMGLFADQAAQAWHNAHLHARNRQLAVTQERQRLARALHDSVTQSLYSAGLAAQAALKILGQNADNRVHTHLEHIHTLSRTALMEIREQLYHLHPTVLNKEDLVEALHQHCLLLSQQYNLAIEFKAGLASSLSLLQRDALYYIAREALWNIVKHANARQVHLTLASEGDHVVLSVADDGVGFDLTTMPQAETMGLRGISERAKLLGGVFELQSEPARGTQLLVRIPI
jgi:signal transduction histidine kinase